MEEKDETKSDVIARVLRNLHGRSEERARKDRDEMLTKPKFTVELDAEEAFMMMTMGALALAACHDDDSELNTLKMMLFLKFPSRELHEQAFGKYKAKMLAITDSLRAVMRS